MFIQQKNGPRAQNGKVRQMARELNYEDMNTLKNEVVKNMAVYCAENETFPDEVYQTIIREGLEKTVRIKLSMADLATKFVRQYTETVDVLPLKIEKPADAVEVRIGEGDEETQKLMENIKTQVLSEVEARLSGNTASETVTVQVGANVAKKVKGTLHDMFKTICSFVGTDIPVFLAGPAGCGKSYACRQVAEALGLEFYFTTAVTQEYKLLGFMDAMGTYQETPFYKAFVNGGVFMLDEIDASIPEVLIIINEALASREMVFPNSPNTVKAHPNFRVIAAGNTVGTGATMEYCGRNQLDAASLNRFAVIEMDYSRKVEMSVCGDNKALVDFAHELRNASAKAERSLIVSYRNIEMVAKMESAIGIKEALKTCVTKGMDRADLRQITSMFYMEGNPYYEALLKI